MLANRILNFVLAFLGLIILPVQIVTTLLFGLAVTLTFGLLLLPIGLCWTILLAPMLGLSWVCQKIPTLRTPIGLIFIPWVVIADTFIALMPSMGEIEGRASKLMLCAAWPFTWECWLFLARRLDLSSNADPNAMALNEVFSRITRRNPLMEEVVMRVSAGLELDSQELIPQSGLKRPAEVGDLLADVKTSGDLQPRVVHELYRAYVNAGITDFQILTEKVHADLAPFREGLTERQVRDMFAEYDPEDEAEKLKAEKARLENELRSAQDAWHESLRKIKAERGTM